MKERCSRRSMLATTGCITLAGLQKRSAGGGPPTEVARPTTISLQHDKYHGWPTLIRRGSGQLLVVCSGGREGHVCPFGRVELIRSDDDGKTWTWPRVLVDGPIDDRDAGIVETSKQSLLVTTFTSLAYESVLNRALSDSSNKWSGDRLRRRNAAHHRIPATVRKNELGVWMIRSTDGGLTWSQRYRCLVNSPHGPIQLSDGRLLYAGKELWTERERNGVCESQDDGLTWSWLADIPTRPGDNHREYHELHAVESNSGRIIVHIRNHNEHDHREILQSESTDGGRSWSMPHSTGIWGLPSHLLKLADGRLLMSYGYRRKPFGNQARVSEDDGRTWSDPLTVSADGSSGDLGYPSTAQLADGSLVTVWYERLSDSPRAVLRMARWRLT